MIKKWLQINYHDDKASCRMCGKLTKTTIKIKSKNMETSGRICDDCFLKLVKEAYKENY